PAPVPAPLLAVDTIVDRAALAELARQIEAAGAVGIAALYDGGSAVRGDLGPVLAAPEVAKHAHDVKTLEVLLGQRGLALHGVASDPMLAAYLLDAARTHYDLDVVAASEGVSPPAARGSWMGTGASARPGSDISVEEVGPRLCAEA